jgi:hypothetical protein
VAGDETPAIGEGFDVRVAWRRDDPRIQADAIEMWARLGILPPDVEPEERARQLVAAVYQGDRLAAVCTAVEEQINFLRARFLVLRSMTDPEFRRSHAQIALGVTVMETLTKWAPAHPDEGIAGLIGFVEPGAWGERARRPVGLIWPWTLAAYTRDGQQVRVIWFDHYRLDEAGDAK